MNPTALLIVLALSVVLFYCCHMNVGADPAQADAPGQGHDGHDHPDVGDRDHTNSGGHDYPSAQH